MLNLISVELIWEILPALFEIDKAFSSVVVGTASICCADINYCITSFLSTPFLILFFIPVAIFSAPSLTYHSQSFFKASITLKLLLCS